MYYYGSFDGNLEGAREFSTTSLTTEIDSDASDRESDEKRLLGFEIPCLTES